MTAQSSSPPDDEFDDEDEAPPSSPLARIALKPMPSTSPATEIRPRHSLRASTPGAADRSVLLVVRDALARASLARELMNASCDVRTVAPGDVATCRDAEFDVIVVDAPEREARAAVATVRRCFPDAPLAIRTDPGTAGPISTRDGVRQELVARNAPIEELIAAIDRLREEPQGQG